MNLEKILRRIERLIPKKIYKAMQPTYHYVLATIGNIIYNFPGQKLHIIAVTGTKGKSTTIEFINSILEKAGYKTAILSTIHFKIGDQDRPNKYKMTMPGRFFVSRFVHEAEQNDCDFAIIEMTSEGAKFYRHKGLHIDTLVFTNLTPEHIESHGSFENYLAAKLSLAQAVARSKKGYRRVIANTDDNYGSQFLVYNVNKNIGYRMHDWERDYRDINLHLPGDFNKMNALAAITLARELGIDRETIKTALEGLTMVRGRCEEIKISDQVIAVIDYAHTQESLEKLYKVYSLKGHIIAVLGGTGGGRDKSKRKLMGELANNYAQYVLITDEDPYDDNPISIMRDVASGVSSDKSEIIESRRQAIHKSIIIANKIAESEHNKVYILITGKGTDPYIMRAKGEKEAWDDATVLREEAQAIKS